MTFQWDYLLKRFSTVYKKKENFYEDVNQFRGTFEFLADYCSRSFLYYTSWHISDQIR